MPVSCHEKPFCIWIACILLERQRRYRGWTNTVLIGDKYIERDPDKPPNPIFNQKSHDASARENLQNRILEPEELGPMALLLALPKSKGITGQVISVDGGYKI